MMYVIATIGGILIGWAARWVWEIYKECGRM